MNLPKEIPEETIEEILKEIPKEILDTMKTRVGGPSCPVCAKRFFTLDFFVSINEDKFPLIFAKFYHYGDVCGVVRKSDGWFHIEGKFRNGEERWRFTKLDGNHPDFKQMEIET